MSIKSLPQLVLWKTSRKCLFSSRTLSGESQVSSARLVRVLTVVAL